MQSTHLENGVHPASNGKKQADRHAVLGEILLVE